MVAGSLGESIMQKKRPHPGVAFSFANDDNQS